MAAGVIAMLLAYLLGNSLVQLNFLLSALFNTIFVILSFQFLSTGGSFIIGERLVDTLIGCGIAMAASYLLPNWESSAMTGLARAALAANKEFWRAGLEFARLSRLHNQSLKSGQDGYDTLMTLQYNDGVSTYKGRGVLLGQGEFLAPTLCDCRKYIGPTTWLHSG